MSDEKKKVDDKDSPMEAAGSWWSGLVGEFKRITWPTKAQTAKMTIAAIITSAIVGAIIVGYDFGLGFIYDQLLGIFN
jgi:preprotein translocase SecE subunit